MSSYSQYTIVRMARDLFKIIPCVVAGCRVTCFGSLSLFKVQKYSTYKSSDKAPINICKRFFSFHRVMKMFLDKIISTLIENKKGVLKMKVAEVPTSFRFCHYDSRLVYCVIEIRIGIYTLKF